jgi:diguanylate cyclase (GGDEF)-like protein
MSFSDFVTGTTGEIYTSASIVMILTLMMIVSFRLFLNRRKRAYLSMTVSFLLLAVRYVAAIGFTVSDPQSGGQPAEYAVRCLEMAGLMFLNLGVYQLYNRSRRKVHLLFGCLFAVAAGAAAASYTGLTEQTGWRVESPLLVLDIIVFILIVLAFAVIPRYIGQAVKYRLSLLVLLLAYASGWINRYALEEPRLIWTALENVLPVVYYSILFLFLFDRVVEITQAVYVSSITDGLTGLFNRNHFLRRAARFAQHGKVGVIFSDIDNFKALNDTKGHQAGDDALKQVAAIMREEAEDIGFAGRYGGEEMVMLVFQPKVSLDETAERFRSRVEKETGVTVSVGVASGRKGASLETLIKQADEAMYHAKSSGKNRVVSYASLRKRKRRAGDDHD